MGQYFFFEGLRGTHLLIWNSGEDTNGGRGEHSENFKNPLWISMRKLFNKVLKSRNTRERISEILKIPIRYIVRRIIPLKSPNFVKYKLNYIIWSNSSSSNLRSMNAKFFCWAVIKAIFLSKFMVVFFLIRVVDL